MLDLKIEDPEGLVRTIIPGHFPDENLRNIRFIGNGSCNLVYGARVGNRELVVRFASRNHRGSEHAKEAWCIERAMAAGVFSPAVFAVGAIDETAYMVQQFVPGTCGDDPSLNHGSIWRQLGDYARRIHSIAGQDFIEADSSRMDWAECRWVRYVEYGIESLTGSDRLIELGVYAPNEQAAIRSVFQGLHSQDFRYGLYHGDLSLVNTIVDDTGRITLIDWGCADVGIVPHSELSAILQSMSSEDTHFGQFLSGYGMSRSEFDTLHPKICDFRLLQAFDLVRWSIDRRPEELDDYVSRAAETWARYKAHD
jgi:aminoglycoside phosphotransferase (APT) family kinase protein